MGRPSIIVLPFFPPPPRPAHKANQESRVLGVSLCERITQEEGETASKNYDRSSMVDITNELYGNQEEPGKEELASSWEQTGAQFYLRLEHTVSAGLLNELVAEIGKLPK